MARDTELAVIAADDAFKDSGLQSKAYTEAPTFNGTRYLDDAIESVENQTYSNWELVIVDDASTDETPLRLRGYAALDPRVVLS